MGITVIWGKIKRTIKCQNRKFFSRFLTRIKPESFYSHPTSITRIWYLSQVGSFPHLKHPRDFNEQLLANNLHAYKDEAIRGIRVRCADKYAVRSYVVERGWGEILNECYGVFDSPEEIDFDSLPDQFVLKLTNGCGQNFICKDKAQVNYSELKKLMYKWISDSSQFGLKSAEWHYTAIKPRIIAEKYLSSLGESVSLIDYKFHCMHGKVVGILVCYDRKPDFHSVSLDNYNPDWELTDDIIPSARSHKKNIPRPISLDKMCRIAEDLSYGTDYVRIDLFEIDGEPVFSEMTFTPAGNIMTYYSTRYLKEMLKQYKSNN